MTCFCTVVANGQRFGLETEALVEVVMEDGIRKVPLGPPFVRGVLPYRGEVLTIVDLPWLLQGGGRRAAGGCVVVMDGGGERFGLMVEQAGRVLEAEVLEALPAGVGGRGRWLFGGVWRLEEELVAKLEPGQLSPGRLRDAGAIFKGEQECGS